MDLGGGGNAKLLVVREEALGLLYYFKQVDLNLDTIMILNLDNENFVLYICISFFEKSRNGGFFIIKWHKRELIPAYREKN